MRIDETELIRLLQELISINSVNPDLAQGGAGEAEIAEYVATYLRTLGLDAQLQAVAPNRPNVISIISGRRSGKSLIINAHLDTVGTQGMPDAFAPLIENGRIYGRGALDTKGGLAAMLAAAKILSNSRDQFAGEVILTGVVDEEYKSIGTEALVKQWKADGAIVLEPTDLRIVTAHKGFMWIEVETKGRAAHGSRPDVGIDAITKMGEFLHELSQLQATLSNSQSHPKLGAGSLHASLISGGRELSTYPDQCILQIERRTIPGESSQQVSAEIEQIIDNLKRKDTDFQAKHSVMFWRPSYEIAADNPLVKALVRSVERVTGRRAELIGQGGWADSALLGEAGTPAVVFGPGGEGLHALVEYAEIDQVIACADILTRCVLEFLT